MQSTCPKCSSNAFRMLPETEDRQTDIECLNCGYVTTFVATVTRSAEEPERRRRETLSLVDRDLWPPLPHRRPISGGDKVDGRPSSEDSGSSRGCS
jgi:hypothetical protein